MILINIIFIKFTKRLRNVIHIFLKLKIKNNINFNNVKMLNNLEYFRYNNNKSINLLRFRNCQIIIENIRVIKS